MSTELCSDLWTQVLLQAKLEVKNLLVLRSVCKTWCSIIDNPEFLAMHLKLVQQDISSSCDNRQLLLSLEMDRHGFEFKRCIFSIRNKGTLRKNVQLVEICDRVYALCGSCYGLILILCFFPKRELILWNPAIRISMLLPPCPLLTTRTRNVLYTLGFSRSTRDFKVAAFQVDKEWPYRQKMSIAVYTIIGGQHPMWKTISHENISNIPRWGSKESGYKPGFLYFQGAVHWIVCGTTSSTETHLISFDFDTEILSCVQLPEPLERGAARFLFLLGESLAIISVSRVKRRVWVMDMDCCGVVSWSVWFSGVSNEEDFERFFEHGCLSHKIFYLQNGGTTFTFGNSSYDIGTAKLQPLLNSDHNPFTLEAYSESLALYKLSHAKARFP